MRGLVEHQLRARGISNSVEGYAAHIGWYRFSVFGSQCYNTKFSAAQTPHRSEDSRANRLFQMKVEMVF